MDETTFRAVRKDLEGYVGLQLTCFAFIIDERSKSCPLLLFFSGGLIPHSDIEPQQMNPLNSLYTSKNYRYLMAGMQAGVKIIQGRNTWFLRLGNCDWRIESENGIIGSKSLDFSEASQMIQGLSLIEGKILKAIEFEPPYYDLIFKFAEDLTLRTFSIYTDEIVGNWAAGWFMDGKGHLEPPVRTGDP